MEAAPKGKTEVWTCISGCDGDCTTTSGARCVWMVLRPANDGGWFYSAPMGVGYIPPIRSHQGHGCSREADVRKAVELITALRDAARESVDSPGTETGSGESVGEANGVGRQ